MFTSGNQVLVGQAESVSCVCTSDSQLKIVVSILPSKKSLKASLLALPQGVFPRLWCWKYLEGLFRYTGVGPTLRVSDQPRVRPKNLQVSRRCQCCGSKAHTLRTSGLAPSEAMAREEWVTCLAEFMYWLWLLFTYSHL